jgi:hypothetical protein
MNCRVGKRCFGILALVSSGVVEALVYFLYIVPTIYSDAEQFEFLSVDF